MADINPFESPPLYEHTQVIRMEDLIGIRNGVVMQYSRASFFDFDTKEIIRIKLAVIDEMIHWLAHGKPVDGVKPERDCKGEHDEKV